MSNDLIPKPPASLMEMAKPNVPGLNIDVKVPLVKFKTKEGRYLVGDKLLDRMENCVLLNMKVWSKDGRSMGGRAMFADVNMKQYGMKAVCASDDGIKPSARSIEIQHQSCIVCPNEKWEDNQAKRDNEKRYGFRDGMFKSKPMCSKTDSFLFLDAKREAFAITFMKTAADQMPILATKLAVFAGQAKLHGYLHVASFDLCSKDSGDGYGNKVPAFENFKYLEGPDWLECNKMYESFYHHFGTKLAQAFDAAQEFSE